MSDEPLLAELRRLEIETPSWGYGNSGTRFHVYPWPGAARNVWERIADAALVHRLTGCCPSVAIHMPWDRVDDWGELRRFAEERGIRIGASTRTSSATTPTGSAASATRTRRCGAGRSTTASSASRSRREVGSTTISLWLADGTNYPGQDDLRARYARLTASSRSSTRRCRRDAPARRVQVLRARLLQHRPARLGHRCARLPPARPAGAGARRHGPPRAGHERRADRRASARRGPARRLPLQQPQVRRRRPDRRLDRPLRALPDHARDRARADGSGDRRDRRGGRVHDRPVAQRRGQDRRDDPVGR